MAAPVSARQAYPPARTAWYMVGVLMLCYTLSYADRQILAFLVEPLKHDLEISDTQFGLLQGAAFALVYTFFGLPMERSPIGSVAATSWRSVSSSGALRPA